MTPERMREVDLPQRFQAIAGAAPDRRRRPLADAVEAQDGRALVGTEEERGSRVRLMVLRKQQLRQRSRRALAELEVVGVSTTAPFHHWLLDHDDFINGRTTTTWAERTWQKGA
jgi:hypothetical protein